MIMSLSYQFFGRHTVTLLRVIFITRVSADLWDLYFNYENNAIMNDLVSKGWTLEQAGLRYLLLRSCESHIALFSLASCIAILSKLFHQLLLRFMMVEDAESATSAGTLSGLLFVIICCQCNITTLRQEDRYWRLLRNLSLIVIVNIHALFKPVSDRLQSLSASRSKTIHKHLRVLAVGLASILVPVMFLTYLWSYSSLNSWTMAVAVFGFEMVFRMTVSLIIYTICMINSFCDVTWRGLEDQIYYLKASCGIISYICGISLFCNGTWVYIFENSTVLRAISLVIHLYFNIWNQGWKGWNVFNKRRMADAKINYLRDASDKELATLDDVCSICFQQLEQAKVTGCNHYFHADCLTRWLYLQDTCPICCSSSAISSKPTSNTHLGDGGGGRNINSTSNYHQPTLRQTNFRVPNQPSPDSSSPLQLAHLLSPSSRPQPSQSPILSTASTTTIRTTTAITANCYMSNLNHIKTTTNRNASSISSNSNSNNNNCTSTTSNNNTFTTSYNSLLTRRNTSSSAAVGAATGTTSTGIGQAAAANLANSHSGR